MPGARVPNPMNRITGTLKWYKATDRGLIPDIHPQMFVKKPGIYLVANGVGDLVVLKIGYMDIHDKSVFCVMNGDAFEEFKHYQNLQDIAGIGKITYFFGPISIPRKWL